MIFFEVVKNIKKCKSITKKEQNKLITMGFFETILNFYKKVLAFPFSVIRLVVCGLTYFFEWLATVFDTIQAFFENIIRTIYNNLPTIYLTKGQARDKVLKELKENNFYKNL